MNLKFPPGFLIGSGSSGLPFEKAWDFSGIQGNILNSSTPTQLRVENCSYSVNFTSPPYCKLQEDVKLIKTVGFDTYRIFVSWARILPNGYPDVIDREGLNYYNILIDELLKYNIEPIVTVYDWDHPKKLEEMGGWLNERMAYYFSDYARLVYKEFGDRVKIFTTMNRPRVFCALKYQYKFFGQQDNFMNLNHYTCTHHMLKAHALAYHAYNREFRRKQQGIVGMNVACSNFYSKNINDHVSSDIGFEFSCGHLLHPIFGSEGDYSPVLKRKVALRSKTLGHGKSKLPAFSKEWIQHIKGSADYLGLSHYASFLVEQLPFSQTRDWPNDEGLNYTVDPGWPSAANSTFKVVPKGFGDVLRKIRDKYNNPPVYVLENGVSDDGRLSDDWKINHLHSFLREMLVAINRDGCNVRVYTIWSFFDGLESSFGYR
ncbi:myrosinase 1-like [Copidosoma floridanum]|uniref:myrosinase 1-like n=1 Tax=Copidosoma floridanum TaxID=29053 RepID=UPI0006C9D228|nr:myrosinase 1-like [Copidosoma floridanum]